MAVDQPPSFAVSLTKQRHCLRIEIWRCHNGGGWLSPGKGVVLMEHIIAGALFLIAATGYIIVLKRNTKR